MKCFIVSHSHWDREWYRTFQKFRGRLVDLIDCVLALQKEDPGYCFMLDGQTIVVEDYLEVRPERKDDLAKAIREGRMAIGPWFIQPDSLLPSGETHIRNLLEGRRSGEEMGTVSRTAYVPDSFGHPAQMPQIFAGFGLGPFVYWRGNGEEIEKLPSEYLWEAPDGTAIMAYHLWEAYFGAMALPEDAEAAASMLEDLSTRLANRSHDGKAVLLMNGFDHALPDAHTAAVVEALERRTGWEVKRALLDDFAAVLPREGPRFRGELLGGFVANLLPGVWSARIPQKLRNRRIESLLQRWMEPWCAFGSILGLPDERPSLRKVWRELLSNQAHDSICGCSQDLVHEQMEARYDAAEELAEETTSRILERIAGHDTERRSPWNLEFELAVFNPSPHSRTDVVRMPLDPYPWMTFSGEDGREASFHPWLMAGIMTEGFTLDGRPARLIRDDTTECLRLLPNELPLTLEFVARDIPPFGWRSYKVAPAGASPDEVDQEREISVGSFSVKVAPDGTFDLTMGERVYTGLCGLEDTGDGGDTYDYDPVGDQGWRLEEMIYERTRHPSGIQSLKVWRTISLPAGLGENRQERLPERVTMKVECEARLIPGVDRVDLGVRVVNRARDHRLRLLFPTGAAAKQFYAASTFDIARRNVKKPDDSRWIHPAPSTFPQQGFVCVNGLTVVVPGLPEAEVTPEGVIALTLVRAVGWLSRMDLNSRPQPAGPGMPVPGAQCLEMIEANLALIPGLDARAAGDAELKMKAVAVGEKPLLPPERSLLSVEPRQVLLSAFKPAEQGRGAVLRLLNPTDSAVEAQVKFGFTVDSVVSVRLDETPDGESVNLQGSELNFYLPSRGLRSFLLT